MKIKFFGQFWHAVILGIANKFIIFKFCNITFYEKIIEPSIFLFKCIKSPQSCFGEALSRDNLSCHTKPD